MLNKGKIGKEKIKTERTRRRKKGKNQFAMAPLIHLSRLQTLLLRSLCAALQDIRKVGPVES